MKKTILLGLISLIFIFSNVCYAEDLEIKEAEFLTSEEILRNETDISNQDEELDLENIIEDDLYAVEDEVNVTKPVDGNVYIVAKNVTLDCSYITGNVFILAQNINIINNTNIYGSVYTTSQNLKFDGKANYIYSIAKDANFDKKTQCYRNLKILGDNVTFNGYIGGNFESEASEITIGENAVIDGALNYSSKKEANINSKAKVGQVNYDKIAENTGNTNNKSNLKSYLVSGLSVFVRTLIIAMFIVLVIKKYGKLKRSENLISDLLVNGAIGILSLILIPIIAFILFITIILAPISIIMLLFGAILLYLSSTVFAIEVAKRMKSTQDNNKKLIIFSSIVALVIWGLSLLPVVGTIVEAITIIVGFGVLIKLVCAKV